ncbi:glycosyltransferase family 2 protein [Rhodoplanes sp. Z2-YC6860]|uniref:glycosyltransferase family 2 protein n=1 Tax=Rhodoplanes sp. Z2-YC6860 TaxID=674703 RepID=UPI00078D731C|nr:glycosyltransferase family 2 protein [Rhodoplanes sp. Z2-YC6860]AMN39697.1 glycosyl transferase family protein [Rhodoplanes sp. Z2-YC6860]
MEETPRVTVLLPTHNRADVLGYAIQSVLWQTEKSFEFLIVGDGCTDNTREVVATFSDPRIRWIDLPKAPLSGYANRNIALRQARGQYVVYAQHDDILLPDHIERLIATIEASDADWAYSRPLWVARDGVLLPFAINLCHRDELEYFLKAVNHVPSTCVIHTRSALERVGYWPEDVPLMADWHCWRQIIMTSANRNAGYCRMPTALHFHAAWKQSETPEERRMRTMAKADWWPKECIVPIPTGVAEQRIFFEILSAAPVGWVDQMRAAVVDINDRLAWAWTAPEMRTWPNDDDPALLAKQIQLEALENRYGALEKLWNSRQSLSRQLVLTLFRKLRRGEQ